MNPPPATPSKTIRRQWQTDPEKVTDENGLTKKNRDNLLTIRRMYKGKWAILRRARIRNVLKKTEYRRSVGVCEAVLQQLAPSAQYLATIG